VVAYHVQSLASNLNLLLNDQTNQLDTLIASVKTTSQAQQRRCFLQTNPLDNNRRSLPRTRSPAATPSATTSQLSSTRSPPRPPRWRTASRSRTARTSALTFTPSSVRQWITPCPFFFTFPLFGGADVGISLAEGHPQANVYAPPPVQQQQQQQVYASPPPLSAEPDFTRASRPMSTAGGASMLALKNRGLGTPARVLNAPTMSMPVR